MPRYHFDLTDPVTVEDQGGQLLDDVTASDVDDILAHKVYLRRPELRGKGYSILVTDFELLDKPARGKKCDAIEGILDEGTEIMDEYEGEPALAAAQAVEHCEISRYGTLETWASKLGLKDAVKLLDQTPG
jgi:ferritin-like metal-binding protein YciE